jgi:hypothetical protein
MRALRDPLHVGAVVFVAVHGDTVCSYSILMQYADDLRDDCLCGGQQFDRVTVDRPGGAYVTQFLACRSCGVMYFAPIKPGGWGAPAVVPTRPKSRRTDRET